MAMVAAEEFGIPMEKLIARVVAGEEVVLTEHDQPRVRLVPVDHAPDMASKRGFGALKGRISLSVADALAPLPPGWDGWPEDARN